jgi:hypothetical protein
VYVDGPYQVFPQRAAPDAAVAERLEDAGYRLIRVQEEESWPERCRGMAGSSRRARGEQQR